VTPAQLRSAARALAAGRVALGAGLVLAPVALGKPWLGDVARAPGGKVALRALGVRDVMLGGIALHVAGRGGVASRALQTNAVADLVDLGVTLAARRALPPTAAGVAGLAGGGALSGVLLARRLAREAPG
jgi:hypothetical protein